jgi:hypothetical protein
MGTTYNINLNSSKTLLAGPWIGELGWELFCWQGYLRQISKDYKKVIVACKKGHEFIYKDFCHEFIEFNVPEGITVDSWFSNGNIEKEINQLLKTIRYDIRLEAQNIGFLLNGITGEIMINKIDGRYLNQKFIKFSANNEYENIDIVLHPRNRTVGSDRNWDADKWQKLINLLIKKYKVGVIGNGETFELKNMLDFRNIPIEKTIGIISNTKLVVGQSSGPMHLASLCGTPHLVWSSEHNRNRYLKYWNPFKTPCYFYSEMGWNPSVEFILDKIIENIK